MNYSHDFVKPPTPFPYRYRKCIYCKQVNIFKAAYKCKDCRKVCHRKCHKTFVEMELKRIEQLEQMKSTIEINNNNEMVKKMPHQYCNKKRDIESKINNNSLTIPNELPSTTSFNGIELPNINNPSITVSNELSITPSLNGIESPNINNPSITVSNELPSTPSLNGIESPKINNPSITVSNELPSTSSLNSNILNGRRIVDIGHIFNEIQNIRHSGGFGCSFSDMILKREEINGYFSIFYFHCKMCHIEKQISSENIKNFECIPINKAVVNSTIAIGIGYAQLSELSACIDIPSMSSNTYQSLLSSAGDVVHDSAWDEIKNEGDEETSKNGILDEIVARKSVHEIGEKKEDELQKAEKEQYKLFQQTYQDPNTCSSAVNTLQDVQQIESNGAALGQTNFTMEENNDISTVSADIKYETELDLNANELEKVIDGRSQKKSFWRRMIPFRKPNRVETKSSLAQYYLMLNF